MNKWNNKFRYQVASCGLFILSYTTMHGSMNIKSYSNVAENSSLKVCDAVVEQE